MTEEQWATLEKRIDDLLDSHAALREDNRKLQIEKQELLDQNAVLRTRLEAVVERIKRLEMETDT
jgi:predicted nuclease with TOPRIM domain